ncbi:MAG: HAMP domain-containing sensor histidine kinase [Bacteroidetes bacterium]|nr:HAMP domain-containing sensor histidine kinase [Bacteroidota bacterium]
MFGFISELITRAKLHQQIKTKNAELKKINDELDHFVYATSHELRSPLSSILGILNLMEKDVSGVNTVKHIHLIRSGINKVDVFVKRVLDYSRNNRASVDIELIYFDLLIKSVIESFKVDNKEILFLKDIHEWHPFYSDPKRTRQIIENLFSNAIKYSTQLDKPAFVSIRVITKMDRAIIIVRDNGIGIAAEHQNKIFEMFYRVSSEKPGTGMGLYLVKELVEKLKGNIIVESELNKGTKFMITLLNLRNERTL